MPQSTFHFQQFSIEQDQCAMKISTDGILLGAWAPIVPANHILDIGTGTGLLALMAAQRNRQARITGIDIAAAAAAQASKNAANSPWSDRITILQADFLTWQNPAVYDQLICNPPYFGSGAHSRQRDRAQARHLPPAAWQQWLDRLTVVAARDAGLSLIYPASEQETLVAALQSRGWYAQRRLAVRPTISKPVGRCLWYFRRRPGPYQTEELIIHQKNGDYSADFMTLTQGFYLGWGSP